MADLKFSQKERIKKKDHFTLLFKDSNKIETPYFILYYLLKRETERKIAFIASKKVGNAVVRNKVKRQLKEIVRQHQHHVNKRYDLALVARGNMKSAKYRDMVETFKTALQDEGLWLD